ncbi:helix-turn-helix domain-containing protein [Bergeyella sp. RCAD1439]|uniref:helix-turn-helix domain-containing protein n=1 Tax=Bergeyella anatis TaxID=3113737 RepID=UPI002E173764|nr:helix-turn-helix domain-containing protein [Bergeyella sp. RCAD1439]
MALEVLTKEDLQEFKTELLEDIKNLFHIRTTEQKLWLKSSEVKELFKCSSGTLQTLRINGTLRYSRIGGTLYYNYQDIEKLLNSPSKPT